MDADWNSNEPIYLQLKERVVGMILDGSIKEGDALPSVRTVASDYQINPLTVLKAYQLLVDQDLVEKRRGLGMFVRADVHDKLASSERKHFLDEEWPIVVERIQRLGLKPRELLKQIQGDNK
ncbi:MAG: GntR family transcriptional regulator [Gammaproteobacteria bacterium]|nr:GntR family transcriptional regulator [Gammaproteobacteria bacterium]